MLVGVLVGTGVGVEANGVEVAVGVAVGVGEGTERATVTEVSINPWSLFLLFFGFQLIFASLVVEVQPVSKLYDFPACKVY